MAAGSRKRHAQPAALAAALLICGLLALALATAATAQDATATPQPTSEFSFDIAPTFQAGPTATFNPQLLSSLTGVNGRATNSAVAVRSGPGLENRRIGALKQGAWIDITGWNGWEAGRTCSPTFENDLDMWVEVRLNDRTGWIARCVLEIYGEVTDLPLVSANGERTLQR